MQITIEETAPCRKTLRIEVPVDDVNDARSRLVSAFSSQAKIAGFRPGKAPEKLVRARYAKEIAEELRQDLIPRSYRKALDQEKIDVVAVLGVQDVKLEDGQPMTFSVLLDVPPDFKLPDYREIQLDVNPVTVEDPQIDEALKALLDQFAGFEPIEGRPVVKGDLVQVDYKGTLDGEPLEEAVPEAKGLGEAEDFWVRTDEDSFLPGFGDALVGLAEGESTELDVPFPDTFAEEKLRGREAHYVAVVKGLRERKPAEVNDDLLKKLHVASEEELRDRIREDLNRNAEQQELNRLRDAMVRSLLEKTALDVPASEVEEETRQIIRDIVWQNTSRGIQREEIEENRDQIFTAASRNAEETVKVRYILHRIAEEENIEVSDEEFAAHLEVTARGYGMEPAQFRAELANRNAVDNVRSEQRNRKTLDFLVDQVRGAS